MPKERGGEFELSPILTDDETSEHFHKLKEAAGFNATFLPYRPAGTLDTVWLLRR